MAPPAVKKLVCQQQGSLEALQYTDQRIREKDRTSFTEELIRTRLDSIERIWAEALDRHGDIMSRGIDSSEEYVRNGILRCMQALVEDMEEYLAETLRIIRPVTPATGMRTGPERSPRSPAPRAFKVRKVDLPDFNGEYEEWEDFRNLFLSMIERSEETDNTAKLHCLISCMKGPAAEMVKNTELTGELYETTLAALDRRYYCPRFTVARLFATLQELPPIKKPSSRALLNFANKIGNVARSFERLGLPMAALNVVLSGWFMSLLDTDSQKAWDDKMWARDEKVKEDHADNVRAAEITLYFPPVTELIAFLEKRAQLHGIKGKDSPPPTPAKRPIWPTKQAPGVQRALHATVGDKSCPHCNGAHYLWACQDFKRLDPKQRWLIVQRLKLCYLCFAKHSVNSCTSPRSCMKCAKRHNTLLHFPRGSDSSQADATSTSTAEGKGQGFARRGSKKQRGSSGQPSTTTAKTPANPSSRAETETEVSLAHTARTDKGRSVTILATARVKVLADNGARTTIRALLDQGAEASFIAESVVQLLNLPKRRVDTMLSGVGDGPMVRSHFRTSFSIESMVNPSGSFRVDAIILPHLTGKLPSRQAVEIDLSRLTEIQLADPTLFDSQSVDLIIGADLYGQLLKAGVVSIPGTQLVAQDTVLGWIVSGRVEALDSRWAEANESGAIAVHHYTVIDDLSRSLTRFWEVEEVPEIKGACTDEELACDEQFVATYRRDDSGRFVVALPLRQPIPRVGHETRRQAVGALDSLHRRFERDPELACEYRRFMTEYEALGHMTRMDSSEISKPDAWYLAHHAVFSELSEKRKIRVVFDASRRTHDGHCLNKFLKPGPALQRELPLILSNWRRYKYVFTADIVKMFRQIGVREQDQDYQRIVWSPSPNEPLLDYKLTTVTYGTACAPFLAIRTLNELAVCESKNFPLGATTLLTSTYVDDIFDGANQLLLATQKAQQIVALLATAGIKLDKWAANHSNLLPHSLEEGNDQGVKHVNLGDSIKTLGVCWDANHDAFKFNGEALQEIGQATTKRSILSDVARVFDPLGWLVPVTVVAKIIMQDICILQGGWDSPVTQEILEKWRVYCSGLANLNAIKIPRWVQSCSTNLVELHGFCDASKRAYAACVYLCIRDAHGNGVSILLAAKTKVAPVKTKSIPHLELCGAVLLVKLINFVQRSRWTSEGNVFLWTDSRIILAWLNKHPSQWKTFIANRVSYIQAELPEATWSHVGTKENPADLGTRGAHPLALSNSEIWWRGPIFLAGPNSGWPVLPPITKITHARAVDENPEPEILTRFSNYRKLIRVLAYCLRASLRRRRFITEHNTLPRQPTVDELKAANILACKLAQDHAYKQQIAKMTKGISLAKADPLSALTPFVDQNDGLIRVGGRLSQSNLAYNVRHPPILPARSSLSKLIV